MSINQKIFKYLIYYPVVLVTNKNVPKYLKIYKNSQFVSEDELIAMQIRKLIKLIRYSKLNVNNYNELEINENDIKSINDIDKLPFTTKNDIIKNKKNYISKESFKNTMTKTTSGSTGQPLTILKSSDSMAKELAATWRGYSWAGIDIGDRQGRFWGIPFNRKERFKAQLTDFICNRKRCSAFKFSTNDLKNYTNKLINFKPSYFYGYVSMLYEYALYFQKLQIIPPFKLKSIITTSEVLSDIQRKIIKEIFKANVYNEYGCGEVGSVAHQCEYGKMHIMAENMIVEIINGEKKCKSGEIGEIVITELNNFAMPLIRYRTGDFACISEGRCNCGKKLPVIDKIYGRAYDIIKNSEGKLFHGEVFLYIFEDAKRKNLGIEKFQVIQKTKQKLEILMVPGYNYGNNSKKFIINNIHNNFDANVDVEFKIVNKIDREKSGKMRVVKGISKS